jgi:hypothetical protein
MRAALKESFMRVAVVKAGFDDEAGVWWVEYSDIPGLQAEGETFEAFCQNVADATGDLVIGKGAGAEDIYVEIIAHACVRAAADA